MINNQNIPPIQCYVRNDYLHNGRTGHGQFTPCWVIGVRSIQGQALTFYALLENGVLFTGLPIHAFAVLPASPRMTLNDLQMWDCLSYSVDVFELTMLKKMSCNVFLKSGKKEKGHYLFSIDFNNKGEIQGLAETPNHWKLAHMIQLDNGNYCVYPQNRIQFTDSALTVATDVSKLGYKTNTKVWSCEDTSDWSVSDDDNYLYGVEK